ncbi:MAG: lactate utilization protein, partial [Fimbriimonadaceae bacterium]
MGSTDWNEFHETPDTQADFRSWWKSRSPQTFRAKGSFGQGRGDAEEQVGDLALAPVKPTLAPLFEKTKSSLASLGIALITAKTVEQGLTMLKELRPNMSVVCGKELLTAIAGAGFGLKDVWSAQAGITYVDALIAETGTLVISAGTGKLRKASLCPLIHVAIVKRRQIVETLAEAITNLDMRTTVFITGPSRTADIEGVLVKGVHGPGEVVVILVDG